MIGYWLLPAETHKTQLAAIICRLAAKYDAPAFEPHVTLYSTSADATSARLLLEEIAEQHRPLDLAVRTVEHSEKFTKTLFLQLDNTPEAQQLSDAIRARSPREKRYEFSPHLSLVYAHLPAETKSEEACAIQLPFDRVTFDMIAAIAFPRPIKSRADVEAWRTIGNAKLTG